MSIKGRVFSAAAAVVIAGTGVYAPVFEGGVFADTSITASAAAVTPSLKAGEQCGDKIIVYVSNASSYADNAVVTVYVSGNKVKTMKGSALKKAGGKLAFTTNGKKNLKPNTKYTVKVKVTSGGSSAVKSLAVKTSSMAFYAVKKGSAYYSGSLSKSGALSSKIICQGVLCDKKGAVIAGKAASVKPVYVKLRMPVKTTKNANNEQLYKYKNIYVKLSDCTRKSVDSIREKVADYAVKVSNYRNQTYVLCGETFKSSSLRSDCSGLTKQSWLQVGVYLEHIADSQANTKGTQLIYNNLRAVGSDKGVTTYSVINSSARLSYSKLKKGDLLFFLCSTNDQSSTPSYVDDGIGHVGMYIGNGQMVHFTAGYGVTNHPCRVEDLASYETKLRVMRAVRPIY